MAVQTPKQSPDYRGNLSRLLFGHLDLRGWSPANLAKVSGQSKATISRLLAFTGDPYYRPALRTSQAIAQALKLTNGERRELFYTAFPEFQVWDEAAEKGFTVDEANDLLYDRGLPLLTNE